MQLAPHTEVFNKWLEDVPGHPDNVGDLLASCSDSDLEPLSLDHASPGQVQVLPLKLGLHPSTLSALPNTAYKAERRAKAGHRARDAEAVA